MTKITMTSDIHFGHASVSSNDLVTKLFKEVLRSNNVGYGKLYREKRTSTHRSNISGKSVRFVGIRLSVPEKTIQKVLREFNDMLPDAYVAEYNKPWCRYAHASFQIFKK
ncbi:hypothetical protein AVU32_gp002 [Vibrio phage ValKK3]|uniref:Uncharacterized protein n=1 Tax=Vibrio phage ValKK3 TaxID=1610855 RepID=A0A0D4DBA2_9CAUD|nr:hypothetical protein AVU32_gp002 [Vibrio phage ValKK3]AJT60843.1 hypothetical protein [Vibrio phage ValKK3]